MQKAKGLEGEALLCECTFLFMEKDGMNSKKIHFVKSSYCLVSHLAAAVTWTLLSQQELCAWMG